MRTGRRRTCSLLSPPRSLHWNNWECEWWTYTHSNCDNQQWKPLRNSQHCYLHRCLPDPNNHKPLHAIRHHQHPLYNKQSLLPLRRHPNNLHQRSRLLKRIHQLSRRCHQLFHRPRQRHRRPHNLSAKRRRHNNRDSEFGTREREQYLYESQSASLFGTAGCGVSGFWDAGTECGCGQEGFMWGFVWGWCCGGGNRGTVD